LESKLGTLAFYNVENFYANTTSTEVSYLPSNLTKWVENRYDKKVEKISQAISQIGWKETNDFPLFIGLSEVENESVLQDLIQSENIREANYDYVIYESLDERKINVGCLYQKDKLNVLNSEPMRVVFKDSFGEKSYTRDILFLETELNNNKLYLFVVHLPSKLDQEVNQVKRRILLQKIKTKIDEILTLNSEANIMLMGDFNDTPTADNIRLELDARISPDEVKNKELYNPMVKLMSYQRGSLVHRKQWMLFDQMLISKGLLNANTNLEYVKTDIFDAAFLTTNIGKLGAFPNRTFVGTKYLGGYSDHFPVFTIIKY